MWLPPSWTLEPFVAAVVERWELGRREEVAVEAMVGSTNRLWRLSVGGGGAFVVKELGHERVDCPSVERRRRAAAFERHVFAGGRVAMPEPLPLPVPDGDGELFAVLPGSRDQPCLVRVHRWCDGVRPEPVDRPVATAAGEALAAIHDAGAAWSTEPSGTIRWWEQEPLAVIDRLRGSALDDVRERARALARAALDLIAEAEAVAGPGNAGDWVFSQADHKPQNSLLDPAGERLLVLDWDECAHCPPRLEAVESALRWAVASATPDEAFRSFLAGYAAGGRPAIVSLEERDFGKWVAAVLGWFAFQSRRVLGDWPTDAPHERREAEGMARWSLDELERTLRSLPTWARWAD
jgi:aminoglycoside phosphotransferase (APT) family kinase protein